MSTVRWTKEEHATALRMWEDGADTKTIAEEIGRTVSAVRNHVFLNDDFLPRRRHSGQRNSWGAYVGLVETYYPAYGAAWGGWQEVLPEKSSDSIRQKAMLLKVPYVGVSELRTGTWTDEQRREALTRLVTMARECGHEPAECVAELLALTCKATGKKRGKES